jgi:glyoxylase-like metal-dependent hydrolase (beta-lactamase superfamily II)
MNAPEFRIISIGTLSAHPLWDEKSPVRTGHATTTLITAGDANILVNPGLPAAVLQARLSERSRLTPADVTHVFLTTFTVEHYRGLPLFEDAAWLIQGPEREAAGAALAEQVERAEEIGDANLTASVRSHIDLLHRCADAEDTIRPGVDLFPLPGLSPGTCGLLIPLPASTVLICGDAVATQEHLDEGKVLPHCIDVELAQESFREAVEIGDVLVLGRDNMVSNPMRRLM